MLFAFTLAAFGIAMVFLTDATIMFTRRFWLDEYLTSLIVLDPSVSHAIAAVKDGVDTNPPTYHLLLRAFYKVVGGRPEFTFRLFSGLCMWASLIVTYAILRRSFSIVACVIAILGLTCHPLLIRQSSEARFYAPLLLVTVCFAFFFCEYSGKRRGWLHGLAIAAFSVLTCTMHYFGAIGLVAIVAADLIARGPGGWRQQKRNLMLAATGLVALVAMIPFVLGQREGLTVKTWVAEPSYALTSQFLSGIFDLRPVGIVLLVWFALLVWHARTSKVEPEAIVPAASLRPVAGLVGLLTVPLVIALFSVLVQPSMVMKYGIVGLLSVTPIMALLASRFGKGATVVVALAMLYVTYYSVLENGRYEARRDKGVSARSRDAKSENEKQPLVFNVRNDAYMLRYTTPKVARRIVLLDMRDSAAAPPSRYQAYEMHMAAKVAKAYPELGITKPEVLKTMPAFEFMGNTEELEWLRKTIPLRRTAAGLWKYAPEQSAATAPATQPAAPPPAPPRDGAEEPVGERSL